MTEYEISQQISQLERDIAGVRTKIANAESNISYLNSLKNDCGDYQTDFEDYRRMRKKKITDIYKISGQQKLVEGYEGALEELLNGSAYVNTNGHMDSAKNEIDMEIERQKQMITGYNSQISGWNNSISYWRQQKAE